MTPEQKEAAVEYVENTYCRPSGNNIETDTTADSDDTEFNEGPSGVWVQAWLFVPAAEIPGYLP